MSKPKNSIQKSKSKPGKPARARGKDRLPLSDSLMEDPDLLRQIIDCIPNGLLLFDPQHRLIAYNENYRELSGLNKKDLEGNPTFKEILQKVVVKNKLIDTGKSSRRWIKECLASFRNPTAPLEVSYHDGRTIKIQDRCTDSGYTVRTYEDITELKNRERGLLESTQTSETTQKRLEAAIESISDGFVLFDSENRLVMCNGRYRNSIGDAAKYIKPGVSRTKLMKHVAASRFKGRPKKERDDWIKLRLKHHNSPGSVLECGFQDGTWIRYQDFQTNDGGRVSLYTDITNNKKIEMELLESERRFQQAIESMPDGLVIYDKDDRLILHNSRYKELTSNAAPYLIPGQTYEKIVTAFAKSSMAHHSAKEKKEWLKERLKQHQTPGEPGEIEFDNGQWVRYTDFKTKDGMLVSLLTDITELKQREQQLIEGEARLEAAHGKLVDAIESMSETFIMFDADDKMVTYNSTYAEAFKEAPEALIPNISMREIVRIMAEKNIYNDVKGNLDRYVSKRIKELKTPGIRELQLSDGSWWLVKSSRTADGGTVFVRENITELKNREKALLDSEARLKSTHSKLVDAIENMTEDFSMFDAEDRLVAYNSRFLQSFKDVPKILSPGIRLGEIMRFFASKGLYDSTKSDIDKVVKERLKKLKTPGTYETEFSDGSWWLIKTNRTSDGGLVLVRNNITELKNREKALLESEARLELAHGKLVDAIENMSEDFSMFDAEDKLIAFNSSYLDSLSDLPKLMPEGIHLSDILRNLAKNGQYKNSSSDIEKIVKERLKTLKTPGTYEIEFADNSWWMIKTNRTNDGGLVIIRNNITEQKAAENALRESEERYALVIKAANEGVWDWNLRTNKIFASDRFEQIVGREIANRMKANSQIVLEEFIYSNMHPDDKPVYRENFVRHLKGEIPLFECEFRVIKRGQKMRWIRNRGLALFDSKGRAYRMTGSMDEITERKLAEEALLEAKETAEIASRAKTDFLANVSHELRTPLNAIIGFSDIMKSEIFGSIGHDKYTDYAHTINDSGQHLLSIINDILDVSQVEVGQLDFNLEQISLEPVFESCLRLIHERADINGLTLKRNIQHGLPQLMADPKRLKQILLNLLSNAVKFTPRKGSVTLKAHQTKAGTLVMSVADTGIGMKAADIPKVMKPFAQVDSRLARKYDGTGLGLPLTKALIDMHGGKMKIRSKPRKGTTVSVYFPASMLTR